MSEKIKCEICGKKLHCISATHLKTHGITTAQYRGMFPDAPMLSPKMRENMSKGLQQVGEKLYHDPEWLRYMFWDMELSIRELAVHAGCSSGTIDYWMNKFDIPRRTIKESHQLLAFSRAASNWISEAWAGGQYDTPARRASHKSPENIARLRSMAGRGRSCWTEESSAGFREKMSGENNPAWSGDRVEIVCENCGKTKMVSPSRAKSQRFCSVTCRQEWAQGENSPGWKGGISYDPYPSEFDEDLKDLIRVRDKHHCAICRLSGRSVHHIDYNKDNCQFNNLITLCRSCHAATNFNREYWQQELNKSMCARGELWPVSSMQLQQV